MADSQRFINNHLTCNCEHECKCRCSGKCICPTWLNDGVCMCLFECGCKKTCDCECTCGLKDRNIQSDIMNKIFKLCKDLGKTDASDATFKIDESLKLIDYCLASKIIDKSFLMDCCIEFAMGQNCKRGDLIIAKYVHYITA